MLKIKIYTTLLVLSFTSFIASYPVFAQSNALEKASASLESNILAGQWRVIFISICIVGAGLLFATGRLAWYWVIAIILGSVLIAGAKTWATFFFDMFK